MLINAVRAYKKELPHIVDGKHEQIIDTDTFNRVQAITNGKRWKGIIPSHKNLLFPLINYLVCEKCGRAITGSSSKGRNKKYHYYHCRPECTTKVDLEVAHLRVANHLAGLEINSDIANLYEEILMENIHISKLDKTKLIEKKTKRTTRP